MKSIFQKKIAANFNVGLGAIRAIANNLTWIHV